MNILKYLNQIGLNPKVIIELSKRLKPLKINKNDAFIQAGERMDRIGILLNGLLVSRYVSDEGKEIASNFYYPQNEIIVVDFESFKNQSITEETIVAIETSHLLVLSYYDFQDLIQEYPTFQKYIFDVFDENHFKAIERLRDFQSLKAIDRVRKFTESHGEIIGKLMVKDKASYVGVSRNIFTTFLKKL